MFQISWACLGQESQNVGNIRAVEILTFSPNCFYVSVQSVRGSVAHCSKGR